MAVMQLPDGRWVVYYQNKTTGGKRRREYFGRGPAAESAAKDRNDELRLRRIRPRQGFGTLFETLAFEYLENKNFDLNSQRHLETRLKSNILPDLGATPAIRITDIHLDKYIQKRRLQTIKNKKIVQAKFNTIARELADIKAILNWSATRRPPLIPINPVRDYKLPKRDDAIILPPTPDETAAILKNAPPHLKRAIALSYYLGLRPGAVELLTLTWDRINWSTQTILVVSAKKGGPRMRSVPIHKLFMQTLKDWHTIDKEDCGTATGATTIVRYRGKPIKSIKTAWKKALDNAGITRRLRPYDLRHHFVTKALEAGADYKSIAEIVGSRPETLMKHYQHVTTELRRQTVSKIPPINLYETKK
jgi:integrase